MAATAVEKCPVEEKDHVENAVVFSFEHAAYAIFRQRTAEGVLVVGRKKVNAEAGGGGLCLDRSRNGGEMLRNGRVDEKKSSGKVRDL